MSKSKKPDFRPNEYVVYPAHGVGQIISIEEQQIAGISLELFVISFEKDKMTLRVPTNKAVQIGMRSLSSPDVILKAMTTLKGKAKVKRAMWSRRAQEYEQKINSGESYIPPNLAVGLLKRSQQDAYAFDLNRREKQILEKLADGLSNRVIAETIHLSEKTVKLYMTQIMHKLHVSNRAQAALKAQEMSRDENK